MINLLLVKSSTSSLETNASVVRRIAKRNLMGLFFFIPYLYKIEKNQKCLLENFTKLSIGIYMYLNVSR